MQLQEEIGSTHGQCSVVLPSIPWMCRNIEYPSTVAYKWQQTLLLSKLRESIIHCDHNSNTLVSHEYQQTHSSNFCYYAITFLNTHMGCSWESGLSVSKSETKQAKVSQYSSASLVFSLFDVIQGQMRPEDAVTAYITVSKTPNRGRSLPPEPLSMTPLNEQQLEEQC